MATTGPRNTKPWNYSRESAQTISFARLFIVTIERVAALIHVVIRSQILSKTPALDFGVKEWLVGELLLKRSCWSGLKKVVVSVLNEAEDLVLIKTSCRGMLDDRFLTELRSSNFSQFWFFNINSGFLGMKSWHLDLAIGSLTYRVQKKVGFRIIKLSGCEIYSECLWIMFPGSWELVIGAVLSVFDTLSKWLEEGPNIGYSDLFHSFREIFDQDRGFLEMWDCYPDWTFKSLTTAKRKELGDLFSEEPILLSVAAD